MREHSAEASGRRALTHAERVVLEGLVCQIGPRLHAYVRRAFPHGVDADEIVAEVFVRAAANIEGLLASVRRDLYLLAAARNLCRDAFRRRRPRSIEDHAAEFAALSVPHLGRLAEDEESARLIASVERLPDAMREVVVLRLSTELTFDEIAGIVAAPLGTVLSRMRQAVARLRQALGVEDETSVGN